MTELTAQFNIQTAQRIAKLLTGPGGDNAGDLYSARMVRQQAGYLPDYWTTLDWMVSEKLVVRSGAGRPGEGEKKLGLTDLGKAFLNQFGTGIKEMRDALAFPPFVYELGPKAFMGFGLGCLEKGVDPKQVLLDFLDGKKTSFQF